MIDRPVSDTAPGPKPVSSGENPNTGDVALLHTVSIRMSRAAPLAEVLTEVVEFAAMVVECDSCFIYVLEDDALVLRASKNPHPEAVDRLKMKMGQGITGWVAEHRHPVVIGENAYQDPRFQLFNELPEDHYEGFLSVPIITRERLVGVINTQSRRAHIYTEREISLIATIGFLVGAEIERARLEDENSFLQSKLEVRTIVERAKGILQRDLGINEDEAYRLMRRESQERRKSMKEISEAVIFSDGLRDSMKRVTTTPKGMGEPHVASQESR